MNNLDDFFLGLDTVSCEAGGIRFSALYDEAFFDESLGGAVFGENAPVLTVQARFVSGVERGSVIEVELNGRMVVFKALDFPREDGTGLAFIPLVR